MKIIYIALIIYCSSFSVFAQGDFQQDYFINPINSKLKSSQVAHINESYINYDGETQFYEALEFLRNQFSNFSSPDSMARENAVILVKNKFNKFIDNYPQSTLRDDAQLFIAYTYQQLNDQFRVRIEYQKLINDFPHGYFSNIALNEHMNGMGSNSGLYNWYNTFLETDAYAQSQIAATYLYDQDPLNDTLIIIEYNKLILNYPLSPLAVKAQYEIGEYYNALHLRYKAKDEFQKIIDNYPNSLYYIGYAYDRISAMMLAVGDWDAIEQCRQRIASDFCIDNYYSECLFAFTENKRWKDPLTLTLYAHRENGEYLTAEDVSIIDSVKYIIESTVPNFFKFIIVDDPSKGDNPYFNVDFEITFTNGGLNYAQIGTGGEPIPNFAAIVRASIRLDYNRPYINKLKTALHEFCHGLGLFHSYDKNDIMFFSTSLVENARLSERDIKTIKLLYGTVEITTTEICEGENYLLPDGAIVSSEVIQSTIPLPSKDCDSLIIYTVKINPLPASAEKITGPATVSQGQNSVNYTVPIIANTTSYVWTLPIGANGTSTTNSISVSFGNDADSGDIKVQGHNACGEGPESSLAVSVNSILTQDIALNTGWNIISANLTPANPDLKTIFQPLIDNGTLKKVMDETGKTIENFGGFGGWVNYIGNLISTEGYKVNVTAPSTLSLEGMPVPLPLDIALNTGWNIISYPTSTLQDAKEVVQALIDASKLKKVMDETGKTVENFGSFGGWKNSIGNFTPGKGYKVNVTESCTLTIPVSGTKSALIVPEVLASEHFKPVFMGNGTDHMNVNLVNLQASGLQVGDQIGVFDGKLCVGSATIGAAQLMAGSISISASSNDGLNESSNGFTPGNRISVKLYRDGKTHSLSLIQVEGHDSFDKNASLFAQTKISETTDVQDYSSEVELRCYPNPFNEQITIQINSAWAEKLVVNIFNIEGKLIRKIFEGQAKNIKSLIWDGHLESGAKALPGTYLINANGMIEKVILKY